MNREQFLKLLDVDPIPRKITVKSLGGVTMCVRALKGSEAKMLSAESKNVVNFAGRYQEAVKANDAVDLEAMAEEMMDMAHSLSLRKILFCLVDEDGSPLASDLSELEGFGLDFVNEISEAIDAIPTQRAMYEEIKKK
jgi:hypothetical protein